MADTKKDLQVRVTNIRGNQSQLQQEIKCEVIVEEKTSDDSKPEVLAEVNLAFTNDDNGKPKPVIYSGSYTVEQWELINKTVDGNEQKIVDHCLNILNSEHEIIDL